jgi:hypothetical protein
MQRVADTGILPRGILGGQAGGIEHEKRCVAIDMLIVKSP